MKMTNIAPTEKELHAKMRRIAEQFYGTAHNPDQIPITEESQKKLHQLHPKTVLFKLIDNEPVSWIVVMPTTLILAEQFVSGKITERELFEETKPSDMYEALYFCSVFTVREHQRKGYGTALLREALKSIPLVPDPYLFCWVYSKEGEAMYQALTKKFGTTVRVRLNKL